MMELRGKQNLQQPTKNKKEFGILKFTFFLIDRMGIFLIRVIEALIIIIFLQKFAGWKHSDQLYQRLKY